MTSPTPLDPDTVGPIRYPTVTADLIGGDGNIFVIIATVERALRRAGVSADERSAFRKDMIASESYDDAIQAVMRWVEVG